MSILIHGMEMPTRCAECWLMDGEDSWCTACRGRHLYPEYRYGIKDKPDWCPLVPVPDHGRLIDADAMLAEHYSGDDKFIASASVITPQMVNSLPTIIPASGGKENDGKDTDVPTIEEGE